MSVWVATDARRIRERCAGGTEVRKGHRNIPKKMWPTNLALNTHAVLCAENHPSANFHNNPLFIISVMYHYKKVPLAWPF